MPMTDKTVQVVIEIPEFSYKNIMKVTEGDIDEGIVMDAIRKGQRLPDNHGRLIDADALEASYGLECATKYGNASKEQQAHSYDTMMMYEIADMLDFAPTIIEADKEVDDGGSDERP